MIEWAISPMRALALVEHYRPMLQPEGGAWPQQMIERDHLPTVRAAIEASLAPGDPWLIEEAVFKLCRGMRAEGVADVDGYAREMVGELLAFPADIVAAAGREVKREHEVLPAIKVMIEICERRRFWRRILLTPLREMEQRYAQRPAA